MQADEADPGWQPRFPIDPATPIATAGTGFAQQVGGALRRRGFAALDVEPPPPGLAGDAARRFGYLLFSARYGAIATPRQLAQLANEAQAGEPLAGCVARSGDRFIDAFRPAVEPGGLPSPGHVVMHRRQHLARVRSLLSRAGLLIFTLGRPEAWIGRTTRQVFPQAPAAPGPDAEDIVFRTFPPEAVVRQLAGLRGALKQHNPAMRMLLTVDEADPALHEAVRGFAAAQPDTDYMPGTDRTGMARIFFAAAGEASGAQAPPPRRPPGKRRAGPGRDDIVCEEILLDAFSK